MAIRPQQGGGCGRGMCPLPRGAQKKNYTCYLEDSLLANSSTIFMSVPMLCIELKNCTLVMFLRKVP